MTQEHYSLGELRFRKQNAIWRVENSCIILWAVSVPWLKNTAQIIVSCVPLLAAQAMQGQTLEWLMLHLGGYGCSLITAHPWPCRLWPHLEPFNDPVFAWGRMVLKLFHCWRQNAVSLNPLPEKLSEMKGRLLVLRGLWASTEHTVMATVTFFF